MSWNNVTPAEFLGGDVTRIEDLEAKLAGAVAECERIGRLWHDADAKLEKAVAALDKLNVGDGWAAQIARTTLAELKEKTPDR